MALVAFSLLAPTLADARPGQYSRKSNLRVRQVVKHRANVRVRDMGMSTYRGKRQIKSQLKRGDIKGARVTLSRMLLRTNRSGVKGQVDRYRKWSGKRAIDKKVRQKKVEAYLNKKHKPIPLELLPYWTKL